MKTTRLLAAATLLVASTSLSFAGPGAQYWQQRRTAASVAQSPATSVASQSQSAANAAVTTQTTDCGGCTSCKAKS